MPALDTSTIPRLRLPALLIAAILVSALLVRLIGMDHRWLWFDELLSATFVAHGFLQTLISNLRFDVHPPLYYLQLNLWSTFGRSDLWLMLNSVFWSVIAVAFLIWGVRRRHDLNTALIAGALLAFAPAALVYGDQVRMYSFLMVLIIWVWTAQKMWLETHAQNGPVSWPATLNLIGSQLALIYSHSAGFVMISGCVLLSAATLYQQRTIRTGVFWVLCQATVAALALPAVVIAMVRDVQHPGAPSFEDVIQTWRFLSAGALGPSSAGALLGATVLAALGYLIATDREKRLGIATLVFAPLAIAALISYAVRPIWLERVFVTVVPFLCLYLAIAAKRLFAPEPSWMPWRKALALGIMFAWAAVGIAGQFTREKGDGYRPAALFAHSALKSGDSILVDGDYAFWCFLWYFGGPDWGKPQQAYILTLKWAQLASYLPPNVARILGFLEQDRIVHVNGVSVVMWDRAAPVPLPESVSILVMRFAESAPIALEGHELTMTRIERNIKIEQWQKTTRQSLAQD